MSISPLPSFSESRWTCGLDISSKTFTARLLDWQGKPCGSVQDFTNNSSGFQSFEKWLKENGVVTSVKRGVDGSPQQLLIVMEATGVYWEECAIHLHGRGFRVNVVNPSQIKAFARTTLRRIKTDATDADLIARFAFSVPLPVWTPPDLDLENLQLIMRQRAALVDMLTEERNRLHAYNRRPQVPSSVIKTTREHIAFLESKIDEMEDSFKDDLKKSPQWQKSFELLTSIPGIGEVTAAVLLTETGAFGSFLQSRQLTAYAGIAPAKFSSGTSVNRKAQISKIGNSRLRRIVYIAAWSAGQSNTFLGDFYRRLIARGKPGKVATVALARKLLVLAMAVVKSGIPFDKSYGLAPA